MIPTPEQEDALIEAVRGAASAEIMTRFRRIGAADADTKSHADDLVTEADRGAERAITAAVAGILPGASVVGEEAASADPALLERIATTETCVIIDPVDGTWNFAKGLANFGVLQEVATSYSTGIPAQLTAHLDPVFNDNMYLAAQSLALGLSTLSALWFWATFYRLGTAAP